MDIFTIDSMVNIENSERILWLGPPMDGTRSLPMQSEAKCDSDEGNSVNDLNKAKCATQNLHNNPWDH